MSSRAGAAPRRRRGGEVGPPPPSRRIVMALLALASIIGGVVAELAVLVPSGAIGEPLRRYITQAVGWTALLLPAWPVALGSLSLLRTLRAPFQVAAGRIWGAAAAYLALVGLCHLILIGGPGSLSRALEGQGGGLV